MTHRASAKSVRVGALAFTAVLLLVVLVVLLRGSASEWFAGAEFKDLTRASEKLEARDAARGRLLQLLGGLGAIGALIFTARSYALSREGHVTDRYAKAVEQLGAETTDAQVGGVYALERIMVDSARDHWPIVEVLNAFVREHSPAATAVPRDSDTLPRPGPEVQAALTVLGRRPKARDRQAAELDCLRLSDLGLQRARLRDAQLPCARLRRTRLEHAHLERANLEGAQMSEADLRHVDFAHARLDHANLIDAILDGATLAGASVVGAHLARARGPKLTPQQQQQVHCLPESTKCDAALPLRHPCRRYEWEALRRRWQGDD